jgi:hypothetical protein
VALHPLSCRLDHQLYDPQTFTGAFLNLPDVYLHAWILAWGTHALSTGNISGLFEANIFHPARQTLAYSEHMLGALPFFAPGYLATGKLTLAFNLWILTTFLLAALAAWWVALRWFGSQLAALVAALAFAFPPWRLYELTHVQILSIQYLPLIAWVVWEGSRRRTARLWWLLFALLWLQAASSYYLGYFAFISAGALGAVGVITAREERSRQALFLGSALGFAALAMLPLSLPYLRTIPEWNTAWTTQYWSVTAYLFPTPSEAAEPSWLSWRTLPAIALLGTISGLANRRYRSLTAGLLLIAVLGVLLGASVSGRLFCLDLRWLHHWLTEVVPGWGSLRVWPRFAILSWIPMCFLVALLLASHATWCGNRRWPRHLLGVILLLALSWPVLRMPLRTGDPPDAAPGVAADHWLAKHGDGAPVLHLPMRADKTDAAYMYRSTLHWAPLLNGYSGYRPPTYELISALARALPESRAVGTLEALGLVRWVVVHRDNLGSWDRERWSTSRLGGRVPRHSSPGLLIFELSWDPERTDALFETGAGVSLFGTPLKALRPEQLAADFALPPRGVATHMRFPARVAVKVRNLSDRTWPGIAVERKGLVGVRFRLLRGDGTPAPEEQIFSRLPADLPPGETANVMALVRPPESPGRYRIVPCLVQAGYSVERCQVAKATTLRLGPEH